MSFLHICIFLNYIEIIGNRSRFIFILKSKNSISNYTIYLARRTYCSPTSHPFNDSLAELLLLKSTRLVYPRNYKLIERALRFSQDTGGARNRHSPTASSPPPPPILSIQLKHVTHSPSSAPPPPLVCFQSTIDSSLTPKSFSSLPLPLVEIILSSAGRMFDDRASG